MNIVIIAGVLITLITAIPVALQLRRHPRGLMILFFAEMWERFSYYGMRALLIFYLTQHFLYDDKFANGQVGAYVALVYLLPLVGGSLADHYLGTRKAVAFGALLLVAGHSLMAVEGPAATQVLTWQGSEYIFQVEGRGRERDVKLVVGDSSYSFVAGKDGGLTIKDLAADAVLPAILPKGSFELSVRGRDPFFAGVFYMALALIVMGVGFLKPNISSLVGQLYPKSDPRRDSGFTLFYYGINLGSFWAAILCGWLGQEFGWWLGFGLAGLGMLAGYLVFVWGKPMLEGHGEPPDLAKLTKPVLGPITLEWVIYLASLAGLGLVWAFVQRFDLVGYALSAGAVCVLIYIGAFMARQCTRAEAARLMLALLLIATAVVFWTLFNQAGSSLKLFAERNTVLDLFGVAIQPAQTASFNSGFILLLAPAFAALWAFLARRGLDPNPPAKFALALLQVSAGFFLLVWGSENFAGEDFRVPMIFLVLAYLLHTTGELCLSPVGLSQMSKLAPPAIIATIMATWFLASAAAGYLSALIAQLAATETIAGQVLDPAKALATYNDVFTTIALWGTGIGAALLVLSPLLGRLDQPVEKLKPQAAE
ncbi:MAG: oligopeptide:H+ symporter [Alphaproteobacteria bacterium]|nr:oligopeptide:H+ symporter [Alphaproteobacteria bacterium]